jgi:aminopeptidase N
MFGYKIRIAVLFYSMIHFRLSFFFLTLIGLYACKPSVTTQNQKVVSKIISQQKVEKPPYQPSREQLVDLLHTKLDVSFDWEKQQLIGLAELTLTPYFYPQSQVLLDAKSFDIHKVSLLGKDKVKELKYTYDDLVLTIQLDKEYTNKDTFALEIDYVAKPNEQPVGGSSAIQQDKGLYFINADGSEPNKPRQIWTQGETEASSKWFPTIDSPNEKTTQEIYITVDTIFTVLSNGEHVYTINNGNGTKTDYWKMDLPHAPYLFMMAIGEYAVVTEHWKDIEVNYYVEKDYEPYAKTIFGHTPEMLSFFSEILNYKYPWNKYSQIIVRDFVSGAMENTTASVFMEDVQIDDRQALDKNWDYIIAHELIHHWFGNLVTCESWSNLPLNEAFANYSEFLWIDHKYGRDEADYHGETELNEYLYEARTKREPLIRFHVADKEDMFDRHSYNKGGKVLHYLRSVVGDEAFFASLNLYLETNKFKAAEIHHLRLAFEEVTGRDLNWFFNQYFLSPGHPELEVKHTYLDGEIEITINQTQDASLYPLYTLPLNIAIWYGDQLKTISYTAKELHNTFVIQSAEQPSAIYIDPEFVVPGTINQKLATSELSHLFSNSDRYIVRKTALDNLLDNLISEGVTNLIDNPILRTTLKAGLKDPFWAIRLYSLELLQNVPIASLQFWINDIVDIAKNDSKSDVQAKAIQILANSEDSLKYNTIYKDGLNAKSYRVFAASLSASLRNSPDASQLNTDQYEQISNLDVSLALADYYLSENRMDKANWFLSRMKGFMGKPMSLYNFLSYFGEYSLKLSDPVAKKEFKALLVDISETSKYNVIVSISNSYIDKLNTETKQ